MVIDVRLVQTRHAKLDLIVLAHRNYNYPWVDRSFHSETLAIQILQTLLNAVFNPRSTALESAMLAITHKIDEIKTQ